MLSRRHCVALLSVGAVVAVAGASALTATGAVAAATRHEAETAPAVCQGTIDSNHAGFSGSAFCNTTNTVGAYAQFTVDVSAAGVATLGVRFANGASARPADLIVNGTTVASVSFESTGAWTTWSTKILNASLNAGNNTIRLNPTGADGLPNIDYLDVGVATPGVLIDETFSAQTTPPNFGFPVGAEVTDAVLNVTKGMRNYTTSVKAFDAAVVQQRTLDLTFDWKTAIASSGMKTGVELRDDQGNLVFAIAATVSELRYGLTGPVSDSTSAPDSLNPNWIKIAFDRTKWYTVNLHLDFTLQRVQYTITTKENAARVMTSGTASVTGKNLAKLVASNYYGTGVQSIDNFHLTVPANPANGRLKGKTMYAFGDSIVYGHTYPRSFVNFTTERELMSLTKYARNGATIGPAGYSGGQILWQVRGAASQSPDYVVFNGGTNDAEAIHDHNQYRIGAMTDGYDPATFDKSTYAGSLETTIYTMRTKWPAAPIVYVAVHKLGSRDWNTQLALRAVTLQICNKWGVTVADVFHDTTLDTRIDSQRVAYTFNGLVNGYPGTGGSGTHPNIAGITTFHVPVLTAALIQA